MDSTDTSALAIGVECVGFESASSGAFYRTRDDNDDLQVVRRTCRDDQVEYEASMLSFQFHNALRAVWKFISRMNKYVDVTAPWQLAKKKSSRKPLAVVLYNLLEGLRVISGLIYPVMPDTAADHISQQLSYGHQRQALVTLHASADGLGTVLPGDGDESDTLPPPF